MLTLALMAAAVNAQESEAEHWAKETKNLEKMNARSDATDEEFRVKSEALSKKCGKDFRRVAVGMIFARVQLCSEDEFDLKYEDERSKVYDGMNYAVRVVGGKITRVIVK